MTYLARYLVNVSGGDDGAPGEMFCNGCEELLPLAELTDGLCELCGPREAAR